MYRTRSKLWEGLHLFASENGDTAIVNTISGRKIFNSVCYKPWTKIHTCARDWEKLPRDQTIFGNHLKDTPALITDDNSNELIAKVNRKTQPADNRNTLTIEDSIKPR